MVQIHDPSKGREYGTTMPPLVILPNKQQVRRFGVVEQINLKIHNKKKGQHNELFSKQVVRSIHLGFLYGTDLDWKTFWVLCSGSI